MNINGDFSTSEYRLIIGKNDIYFEQKYFETPPIQKIKNFISSFSSFILGAPKQVKNIKTFIATILYLKATELERILNPAEINTIASTIKDLKAVYYGDLQKLEFSFEKSALTQSSTADRKPNTDLILHMEYPASEELEKQPEPTIKVDSSENSPGTEIMEYSVNIEPKEETIKTIKQKYFRDTSPEELIEELGIFEISECSISIDPTPTLSKEEREKIFKDMTDLQKPEKKNN